MVTLVLTKLDDCHKIDIISHRFSIQLMKTGRMKGQAFIGLPSEAVAAQALRETNGYLLRGKPIIMVRYKSLNLNVHVCGMVPLSPTVISGRFSLHSMPTPASSVVYRPLTQQHSCKAYGD